MEGVTLESFEYPGTEFQRDHLGWSHVSQATFVDYSPLSISKAEHALLERFANPQVDGVGLIGGDSMRHAVGDVGAGLQAHVVVRWPNP